MSDNYTYSTDFIICPWCGHKHQDSWEMRDGDHECVVCEKPFTVSSYQSREITTTKKEQESANNG